MEKRIFNIRKGIAMLLTTVMVLSMAPVGTAFVYAEEGTQIYEENEKLPVGGWSPKELIEVSAPRDDSSGLRALSKRYDAPFGEDSVFVKGVSTVGYNALSDKQKEMYRTIDGSVNSFLGAASWTYHITDGSGNKYYYVSCSGYSGYNLSIDEAYAVINAYDYDHPAYYWISNTVLFDEYNKEIFMITLPEYLDPAERARIDSLVEAGIKGFASKAEKLDTTLDKIALIHDAIVSCVEYAEDEYGRTETAKWAHSVQGVFDEHKKVVCEGYADAFSLAMNYMGIPNYYITGQADGSGAGGGGGHAWNAVSDDGGTSK